MKTIETLTHRLQLMTVALTVALFAATPFGLGCFEGGSNSNQHHSGNEPDGVLVSYGNIAVDPTGSYFLFDADDQLAFGDLITGDTHLLPGLEDPIRVAFAADGPAIFVAVEEHLSTTTHDARIIAYDPVTAVQLWETPADRSTGWDGNAVVHRPSLMVSDDGSDLVVVNQEDVEVVDSADGSVSHHFSFDRLVADVDILPGRLLITLGTTWTDDLPEAEIVSASLTDGTTESIAVPNCASELVIEPVSLTGYLAPTSCNQDPVSVIDLATNSWVRNLPGFGPVALAPGGAEMVAFIDTDNIDETLFEPGDPMPDDSIATYHLMIIDAATLTFETLPLGDTLPRYTMTPDGSVLLVDASSWFSDGRLRLLDLATRTFTELPGDDLRLDNFVITSDSTRVFSLQRAGAQELTEGLFEVVIAGAVVNEVEAGFLPRNLNITPDDTRLLLREDDSTVWIYAIQEPTEPLVEIDLGVALK